MAPEVGRRRVARSSSGRSSRSVRVLRVRHRCSPHSVLARPAQRPARGPRRARPAGARLAADRRVAVGDAARFTGTLVLAGVVEQVVEGPGRERVDLDQAVAARPTSTSGRVGAGRRLLAAHAGDPRLVAAERVLERRDLAQRAAQRPGRGRTGFAPNSASCSATVCSGSTSTTRDVEHLGDLVAGDAASRRSGSRCRGRARRRPGSCSATRCGSTASAIEQATATASVAEVARRPRRRPRRAMASWSAEAAELDVAALGEGRAARRRRAASRQRRGGEGYASWQGLLVGAVGPLGERLVGRLALGRGTAGRRARRSRAARRR